MKKRIISLALALSLVLALVSLSACNNGELETLKLEYSELQERYEEQKEANDELIEERDDLQSENVTLKDSNETLEDTVSERDRTISTLNTEAGRNRTRIEELEGILNEIGDHEGLVTELKDEISGLESQRDSLRSDVIKIAGEPKRFPAGHLYAGKDFPADRYRIYNGSSNFAVYSSSGRLQVNIILGGRNGLTEYIYTFSEGDEVQARSAFAMVPVE